MTDRQQPDTGPEAADKACRDLQDQVSRLRRLADRASNRLWSLTLKEPRSFAPSDPKPDRGRPGRN